MSLFHSVFLTIIAVESIYVFYFHTSFCIDFLFTSLCSPSLSFSLSLYLSIYLSEYLSIYLGFCSSFFLWISNRHPLHRTALYLSCLLFVLFILCQRMNTKLMNDISTSVNICISLCMTVCLSVYLPVYLPVCMSVYLLMFILYLPLLPSLSLFFLLSLVK